ncbi:hypothetical protein [Streptomyces sp. HM190]|uniref:hypothetical protein n=1 Tax=Streptomyces sp. HM190 TaxID=2695266 RepID=UPI001359A95D|nr:hypothetical protein [Streptomyces sp. HM190]
MYAASQPTGHFEAVSGPVLLVLRLRRTAAGWVRRIAGTTTAGTDRPGGTGKGRP